MEKHVAVDVRHMYFVKKCIC